MEIATKQIIKLDNTSNNSNNNHIAEDGYDENNKIDPTVSKHNNNSINLNNIGNINSKFSVDLLTNDNNNNNNNNNSNNNNSNGNLSNSANSLSLNNPASSQRKPFSVTNTNENDSKQNGMEFLKNRSVTENREADKKYLSNQDSHSSSNDNNSALSATNSTNLTSATKSTSSSFSNVPSQNHIHKSMPPNIHGANLPQTLSDQQKLMMAAANPDQLLSSVGMTNNHHANPATSPLSSWLQLQYQQQQQQQNPNSKHMHSNSFYGNIAHHLGLTPPTHMPPPPPQQQQPSTTNHHPMSQSQHGHPYSGHPNYQFPNKTSNSSGVKIPSHPIPNQLNSSKSQHNQSFHPKMMPHILNHNTDCADLSSGYLSRVAMNVLSAASGLVNNGSHGNHALDHHQSSSNVPPNYPTSHSHAHSNHQHPSYPYNLHHHYHHHPNNSSSMSGKNMVNPSSSHHYQQQQQQQQQDYINSLRMKQMPKLPKPMVPPHIQFSSNNSNSASSSSHNRLSSLPHNHPGLSNQNDPTAIINNQSYPKLQLNINQNTKESFNKPIKSGVGSNLANETNDINNTASGFKAPDSVKKRGYWCDMHVKIAKYTLHAQKKRLHQQMSQQANYPNVPSLPNKPTPASSSSASSNTMKQASSSSSSAAALSSSSSSALHNNPALLMQQMLAASHKSTHNSSSTNHHHHPHGSSASNTSSNRPSNHHSHPYIMPPYSNHGMATNPGAFDPDAFPRKAYYEEMHEQQRWMRYFSQFASNPNAAPPNFLQHSANQNHSTPNFHGNTNNPSPDQQQMMSQLYAWLSHFSNSTSSSANHHSSSSSSSSPSNSAAQYFECLRAYFENMPKFQQTQKSASSGFPDPSMMPSSSFNSANSTPFEMQLYMMKQQHQHQQQQQKYSSKTTQNSKPSSFMNHTPQSANPATIPAPNLFKKNSMFPNMLENYQSAVRNPSFQETLSALYSPYLNPKTSGTTVSSTNKNGFSHHQDSSNSIHEPPAQKKRKIDTPTLTSMINVPTVTDPEIDKSAQLRIVEERKAPSPQVTDLTNDDNNNNIEKQQQKKIDEINNSNSNNSTNTSERMDMKNSLNETQII